MGGVIEWGRERRGGVAGQKRGVLSEAFGGVGESHEVWLCIASLHFELFDFFPGE